MRCSSATMRPDSVMEYAVSRGMPASTTSRTNDDGLEARIALPSAVQVAGTRRADGGRHPRRARAAHLVEVEHVGAVEDGEVHDVAAGTDEDLGEPRRRDLAQAAGPAALHAGAELEEPPRQAVATTVALDELGVLEQREQPEGSGLGDTGLTGQLADPEDGAVATEHVEQAQRLRDGGRAGRVVRRRRLDDPRTPPAPRRSGRSCLSLHRTLVVAGSGAVRGFPSRAPHRSHVLSAWC